MSDGQQLQDDFGDDFRLRLREAPDAQNEIYFYQHETNVREECGFEATRSPGRHFPLTAGRCFQIVLEQALREHRTETVSGFKAKGFHPFDARYVHCFRCTTTPDISFFKIGAAH